MSDIARLIIEQGRQAAEARAAQGQIWGRAVENIAQVPAHVLMQRRADEALAMQRAELRSRLALEAQHGQLNAANLEEIQRGHRVDAIIGSAPRDAQGLLDIPGTTALAAKQDPSLVPHVQATTQKLNTATMAYQQGQEKLDAERRASLGEVGLQLLERPDDQGSFHLAVSEFAHKGLISKDQADQMILASQDPAFIKQQATAWAHGSPESRAALKPDIAIVPEGATPLDKRTMQPLPGFAVTPKPPTTAELDAKAEALYAKREAGQTLAPPEEAALKAYEDRKRVVSDPAALAATERQTRTIDAQTALQSRTQQFTEMQAGRKELTEKVEAPYQTALGSANMLRAVVDAAKSGNKIAGSMQALETAAAAIRAQGLNRINMAEIGVAGSAGSVWDRISGWLGKATAGQPVPPNVQKDIEDFAGVLEKAAYAKYHAAHRSVAGRYGLTEQPLPPPQGMSQAGLPVVGDIFNGGKVLKVTPVP